MHKYWKRGLFLCNALTNCFIIPSLMCKDGSRIFSRSTRLTFETFLDPGCSCSLLGQCTVPQCLSLALLSHSHRKRKFCVASLLSQQQSNDLQITTYLPLMLVVFVSSTNFVSYDSDSFVECSNGMEASTLLL